MVMLWMHDARMVGDQVVELYGDLFILCLSVYI